MEQKTREWLEWRLQGVGSSDAPIVMGKSKFKTKLELWDEKFNKIIKEESAEPNYIQEKGHKMEAMARGMYEFLTGLTWKPKLVVNEKFPFMRASFDGFNDDICEGWECKYVGKEKFLNFINIELPLKERIPAEYYDQIAHQFLVTGAKAIRLTCVCDTLHEDKTKEISHLRIVLDQEFLDYIQSTLAPTIMEFWKSIQDGIRPDPTKDDAVLVENEELAGLIIKYGDLNTQKKSIEEQEKKVKEDILKHPARVHSSMSYEGFTINLERGKITTDYKAAFEAFVGWIQNLKKADTLDIQDAVRSFPDQPNLSAYTKASAESFKILTPSKKKKDKQKEKEKEGDEKKDEKKFINPITNKVPRGWADKTDEEKITYLVKESKAKDISPEHRKIFLDHAEELENKKGPDQSQQTQEEKIGGITFPIQ